MTALGKEIRLSEINLGARHDGVLGTQEKCMIVTHSGRPIIFISMTDIWHCNQYLIASTNFMLKNYATKLKNYIVSVSLPFSTMPYSLLSSDTCDCLWPTGHKLYIPGRTLRFWSETLGNLFSEIRSNDHKPSFMQFSKLRISCYIK